MVFSCWYSTARRVEQRKEKLRNPIDQLLAPHAAVPQLIDARHHALQPAFHRPRRMRPQQSPLHQTLGLGVPRLGPLLIARHRFPAKFSLEIDLLPENGQRHHPVRLDVFPGPFDSLRHGLQRGVFAPAGAEGGVADPPAVAVGDAVEREAELSPREGADRDAAGGLVVVERFGGAEGGDEAEVGRRACGDGGVAGPGTRNQ